MIIENEIEIHRPIGEVFEFLANLENIPTWNYAIETTRRIDPGPVGVGSEFRQIRKVPSRSVETIRIDEYEPPTRLVITGRLGPFSARLAYQLESRHDRTSLVNQVDLTPQGAARLLAPVASRTIGAAVADNLEVLKSILEQR